MELKYKIWFEDDDEKVYGHGLNDLLRYIKVFGSMNKACKAMGMSYTKASEIIDRAEKHLKIALISRTTGGAMGGGSEITEEGLEIMTSYQGFVEEADLIMKELYIKYLKDVL